MKATSWLASPLFVWSTLTFAASFVVRSSSWACCAALALPPAAATWACTTRRVPYSLRTLFLLRKHGTARQMRRARGARGGDAQEADGDAGGGAVRGGDGAGVEEGLLGEHGAVRVRLGVGAPSASEVDRARERGAR